MGNRAVITTKRAWANDGLGIYLHWNGGRDSVEAFLEYCKLKGYRSPANDESYGMARLAQVIANFFGGSTSIGINTLWHLDCDNYDNGVYVVDGWEIVDRIYSSGAEQDAYDRKEMLIAIDQSQPASEQIGKAFFEAETVSRDRLEIGDEVYVPDDISGGYEVHKIVGFGKDGVVNGIEIDGLPYVDKYGTNISGYSCNINNYLRGDEYRVVKKDEQSK